MKKATKMLTLLVSMLVGGGIGVGMILLLERIPGLSNGQELLLYVLGFVMLYVFFLLGIILHEAGHLIFGLLTGWRFVSFRVANLLWLRGQDGRIRRKKFSLAGTAGQCLLAPPPWRDEGFPYALYNMGGVIVNLVTAAICGLSAWVCWSHPLAAMLLMEAAIVSLLQAVTNGIPLPGLTVSNDGSNQLNMMRDVGARRALWIQMSLAAAQAEGKRLREMPDEWFILPTDADGSNELITTVGVFAANRRMDQLDLPGAEAAIRELLDGEYTLIPLHRALLTLDGACCELLAGRPGDLTEALESPAVKQVMKAMKKFISVLRAKYIVALLRDHDEQEAAAILEVFEDVAEDYPYPQELDSERALMTMAKEAAGGAREGDAP